MSDAPTPNHNTRYSGEPFVWLSGMGLAIGLVMIVSLLGVIIYEGVEALWPKRVVEITLAEDSDARFGDSRILVGEVTRRQEINAPKGIETGAAPPTERQLHLGNKDVYGQAFRFIADSDIISEAQPDKYIRFERLEYGPAFGVPLRIESAEGARAGTPAEIEAQLRTLVVAAEATRADIEHIESEEIGDLNARIQELRMERAAAEGDQDAEQIAELDRRSAALDEAYAQAAARVAELRAELRSKTLVIEVPTGGELPIAVGVIRDFYAPNRLSFLSRIGRLASNAWLFVSEEPRESNTEGGIFPAIFGTFAMTVVLSLIVTPFGVLAAIYLREYAKEGILVRIVRIAINNLAGVPSIVFGIVGVGFFVYIVGEGMDDFLYPNRESAVFGTGGLLWASLTLALMTVPVVIVATEEALAAVSRGMREGSIGCGASKWQTIQRVVLPAAAPGIITGMILAMARGAGEVAPLMLVGVSKLAPSLPVDGDFPFVHLDRKFMHLGFHIFDLGFQSPDSEAARPMVFATTLLLILLVVVMNLGAIILRERLRRKYSTGAF